MEGIVTRLSTQEKHNLKKTIQTCVDAKLRIRYLVIYNLDNNYSPSEIAEILLISRSTVYRVAERYLQHGLSGLADLRQNNGDRKLTATYLEKLTGAVEGSPLDHDWLRPTWTRELLIETVALSTQVTVSPSTMSRALQMIGARLGRPKPSVTCPLAKAVKTRRLNEIGRLIDQLGRDEVLVHEDEVDIHLNPKIGMDWMLRGQQKQVLTPGQNQKRYLAGSLNALTGELSYVEYEKKNSVLFVLMLGELHKRYPDASRIRVVLDNYPIHNTQLVQDCLATDAGQRFSLHFLPPYCPDHNRIERVWQDLHANVTRNHRAATMDELMKCVHRYLKQRNREKIHQYSIAA